MPVKIKSLDVDNVQRTDPKTKQTSTVTVACVCIENTDTTAVKTCVTFEVTVRDNGRRGAKVIGTKDVKLPGRIVRELGSFNGQKTVCCDIPGDLVSILSTFSGGVRASVGTRKNKDGTVDISDPNADVETVSFPVKVAVRSGQKLRYSGIVGDFNQELSHLVVDGAVDLPVGWSLDVPQNQDPIQDGYASAILFDLTVRPGAEMGEFGTVVLRTVRDPERPLETIVEETAFQFTVSPPACCCPTADGGAASDLTTASG